ncbi:amidohydrolase [Nocardioides glacieisoli]|uniref:Amidohydrolase n=1 Tax=Nocardioides glacieisoli TaxID=1168730 RepID=A0A4Q2RK82_9ACTN|nr:amidohydrolase [Nocardioides glacieisoli]RYB88676.1 amidohydrolase [Nocardioides glacieisoli]
MSRDLDLILRGVKIRTMDPHRPIAHSIGIWNGWIVGLDEQVAGCRAEREIDLDGATLLPGFHDAHCHTTSFGVSANQLELSDATTIDAVLDRVSDHASALSQDSWVIGVGYLDREDPSRHPTSAELDRAADGRPVWLTHRSGHMCAVSSSVLDLLPDPLPAAAVQYVVRDGAGRPTGLLEEAAMELVKEVVGPGSVESMVAAIDVATRHYVTEGITSITEAGIGCPGVDHSPLELGAWQLASARGLAHTRAHLMVYSELFHDVAHNPVDAARIGLDLGLHTGLGDDRVRVSAMKIWLDGAGSAGRAASGEDEDPDAHLVDDPLRLHAAVVGAHRAGWQVAAHAMGDRAVDLLLDALEEAGPLDEVRSRRHRIEHGGLIRDDQVTRLRDLGIVVAIQPVFITEFGDALATQFGNRTSWSIRQRSLLDAGIVVAASSDRPVAPGAPLLGVQAMVDRVTSSGAAFGPGERVDVQEALLAYTCHAAYAAGVDDRVGTLTARKLADIVVLDDDPVTSASDAADIYVLATIVGGQVVHDRIGALST